MASPFEILGLDPDADDAEIVAAYRERVKEAHPDQGGSVREFRRVRSAYERLQNGYEPEDTDDRQRSPSRDAADPDDEEVGEPDGVDAEPEETASTVEYLNYEVLADYGWELSDDDLFEKAAGMDLDHEDYGRFTVEPDESLLEAAENCGYAWPFACRGGACSNCAVAVVEGELPPPTSHVLPEELIERGIRLSCSVTPATDEAKVVYNVKHLPGVSELLLPPSRFEKAYPTD